MKRLRALWGALSTVLAREGVPGLRAYGVYVPYDYAENLVPQGEDEAVRWLAERMSGEVAHYLRWLRTAEAYRDALSAFERGDPAHRDRPRFDQQWFSGLDATMAYTVVRTLRPRRIVEVGSGHSTRFIARAIRDQGLATRLHSIDPRPRRDIDALCDAVTRAPVGQVDTQVFLALESGDVLFVDGSHALLPGSDVEYLFTRVLPELAPGVVVHLHDVFLPHGYPRAWWRRAYTEQSVLLATLAGGERYRILCPNAWLRRSRPDEAGRVFAPLTAGARESSLWMEVRGAA